MAKTTTKIPEAEADPATGGGTGGSATQPKQTEVDNFLAGENLRNGTPTSDAKYTEYKADVTEGQTIQDPDIEVPAKSAAIFDEQALDPYEVYEAKREELAQKAGRP